ncbi:MAG: ExeM/NucH family extracellular endonuclease, partial [Cytophagales bacterium]
LRRKPWITQGDANGADSFDPSVEWLAFPQNNVDDLGKFSPVPLGSPTATISASTLTASEEAQTLVKIWLSLDKAPSQAFTIPFSISGTGITATDYSLSKTAFQISPGLFVDTLLLTILDDDDEEETENLIFSLNTAAVSEPLFWSNTTLSITIADNDKPKNIKSIAAVQGTGASSPFVGQTVTVLGTVTFVSKGQDSFNGFFIQTPYRQADSDTNTSEAIWVNLSNHDFRVGDYLEVTGTVTETFNLTQLTNITASLEPKTNTTTQFIILNDSLFSLGFYDVIPNFISFPMNEIARERREGMLVSFKEKMTVTENFNLGRYGEVSLSSQGRLYIPTMFIDPNDEDPNGTTFTGSSNKSAITAYEQLNTARTIILDDNSNKELPSPIPYLSPEGTLRLGSSIERLTGVMSYNFGSFRIFPTTTPQFNYNNRPEAPEKPANSNLRVCAYNVENLFNGVNGVFTSANSRGAQNDREYRRQVKKIALALKEIDADIVGLIELENDGFGSGSSLKDLLDSLNVLYGENIYDIAVTPSKLPNLAANGRLGRDAIKNAYIYKPSTVSLVGYELIDDTITFDRIPLTACFKHKSSLRYIFPNVNHFKSKGCGGASGLEADQGDGQSCWNPRRLRMADTLVKYIEYMRCLPLEYGNGEDLELIMGDLNAYREEDPIDFLRSKGYVDLFADKDTTYSFVFFGQAGSLDHALAKPKLAQQLVKASKWHINCDEPVTMNYGDNDRASNKPKPQLLNMNTPFRSSDHDPIILDFKFELNTSTKDRQLNLNHFPNPTEKELFFGVETKVLSIKNVLGESMMFEQHQPQQVDLGHLPKGIYFVTIMQQQKQATLKIVKK